ncbi:MAG TPA: GH25 family lysozyme [Candidatus Sulfotelmatobacter sp.]|nr:GH25 family lysozyme [Candidatus Sulfotelmatobacter sp.]
MSARAQKPLGCDISGFQPSVNWSQVTNTGVKFCWTKATEGTYYVNPYIASQVTGAKNAKVYIGAYHYARPSDDPNITGSFSADTEAAYFWTTASNYVKSGGTYLVPVLDWEDVDETDQLSAATLSAWVNEWCLSVSNRAAAAGVVGVRPAVYTGTWYSQPSKTYSGLTTAVTVWPNWMSDYSGNPQTGAPTTYPWASWKAWQYDDTNTSVANWSGGDVDVYNGNLAGFIQTFVIGSTNAPLITTAPTNITVALGASAAFSVRASGQAPLGFQWDFNNVPIPSATSSNYTVADVQLTNAGSYFVTVSNAYADVPSSPVFLSVLAPLTNAPASVLAPANLVDWWTGDGNFNDLAGTNDLVPNGNLAYTSGVVGPAFEFDGSSSYLLTPDATEIPAGWTACFWVNRQNAPGSSAALMGDDTYALKLEQYNGTRMAGISQAGVADYLFTPNYTVPVGVWTHLAFVGNSLGVTLYTNGVRAGSVSVANFPLPRTCIGADLLSGSTSDLMLGGLDEIQVFNRVLLGPQIASIYAAGSAGLVRAPEFTGLAPAGAGQVRVNLRGLTGRSFSIYVSTNLMNWSLLSTNSNPTGAVQFIDATVSPQKFYRATQ